MANSITLSPGALKNISFRPLTVQKSSYMKSITLPGIIVERPGRSQIQITAPLTGIVTRIVPVNGSAIEQASPLFEIRLTHEELVTAQAALLRTAENIDVVNKEILRLKTAGEGVVPGKRVVEQEYEKQRLEASLRADRQALLLHGLNDEQIDSILERRQLIQSLTVRAPAHGHDNDNCGTDHLFHVQSLTVSPGQQVEAGAVLCVLADHCELYIEGQAFEDDAARLREASRQGWTITASVIVGDRVTESVDGLQLLYLADRVEPESRAFKFYLRLPNSIALDQIDPSGTRFLDWRFKPGQRMQLKVPVEKWSDRIVLPIDAIVDEGPETFAYRQNGNRFDRISVHAEYRDQESVVIASDGTLFPGDVIAANGAYQMHLAAKNHAGGGVDPHAGHNH
ncbi:MAG: efflux RND transporter periplasmic adaptor subunit [Pirellulales bacterium]